MGILKDVIENILKQDNSISLIKDEIIEMARLNKKEIGAVAFPSNKFDIRIWSNDHEPPHFHILYDGWDISFLIENGEEYRINNIGNSSKDYNYICRNVKPWLSMQCKTLPKLTNKENAENAWEILH